MLHNTLFKLTINFTQFFYILACMFLFLSSAQAQQKEFMVFDATAYQGKPNLNGHGVKSLKVVYEAALWPKGASKNEPNEATVRKYARTFRSSNDIFCIDVEHWPIENATPQQAKESVRKLKLIAKWFKEEAPNTKIGFYGILPVRNYWAPVLGKPKLLEDWKKNNESVASLAESVDVIFPSLYTFYDRQEEWAIYAKANLEMAGSYNKPVYAFIWPEYHDSNKTLKGEPIPKAFWRKELDVVFTNANGVAFWGGYQKNWSESASWWQETKDFLREKRMAKIPSPPLNLQIGINPS